MIKFKTHLKTSESRYSCNQTFYQMPISIKTSAEEFKKQAELNPESVCKKCLNNLQSSKQLSSGVKNDNQTRV